MAAGRLIARKNNNSIFEEHLSKGRCFSYYLRVDYGDDDALIEGMISAAVKQCMDILRTDSEDDLAAAPNGKIAVMFTAAYLYEHREEADHHALNLTLRALLFGSRKEGF